jgi:hypothetical protein
MHAQREQPYPFSRFSSIATAASAGLVQSAKYRRGGRLPPDLKRNSDGNQLIPMAR